MENKTSTLYFEVYNQHMGYKISTNKCLLSAYHMIFVNADVL